MTYYTFERESNDFKDILSDPTLKKKIVTKITWKGFMMIQLEDYEKKLESYIVLKYGDELRTGGLVPDRTPVPFKDYQPKEPRWLK
jgi:hypothetical protein